MIKLRIILPVLLIIIPLLVYIKTMPPSILWVDSGTMIAASYTLGIPNPPGFPFYMLASHLFSILPFFNVLTRLEIFTIIFSLGTLFLVYRIILLILNPPLGSPFGYPRGDNVDTSDGGRLNPASPDEAMTPPRWIVLSHLSAFFGAFSLAFSYQFWSQSQNTEAFIFTYFFVALFTCLLLGLFKETNFSKTVKQYNSRSVVSRAVDTDLQITDSPINRSTVLPTKSVFKTLLLIAFLYGLAAGANPTAAALVPGVLYIMYLNKKYLNIKKLIILGLVFAITLSLVYSYLPIRAKAYPFVNWGNPQTLKLFLGHLHGEGLNIYEPESGSINGFTGSPLVFFQSVSYYVLQTVIQFTPILFPLIILGMYFIFIFKKSKRLFLFLLSVPVVNVIYAGFYYSGNQESWFILSWIFFAVFLGVGVYYLTIIILKSDKRILLFPLCLLPLVVWFSILNRSNHYYTFDYAKNLYDHLEKNAILLATGDSQNSLGNYLRVLNEYRSDVIPITANMFYVNKWHRDSLRKSTDLSISPKIDEIIQYKSFSEYNDAMNQLISENIDKRPIYATHLTLRASALAATSGGQLRLDDRFKFVPNGLTLKIVKASDSARPNLKAFDFIFKSPLSKQPFYLERNYKGAFKNILNDYVYAYESLGDWYADSGNQNSAFKYYRMAEKIEPENAEVLAHLGEFYAKRKEYNIAVQYFKKALIFSPKNVFMHFNLGLSYVNSGKTEKAIEEFNAVKILSPLGDPIINDAENIIKQISAPKPVKFSIGNMKKNSDWKNIESKENNFRIKIPKDFYSSSPSINAQGKSSILISDSRKDAKLSMVILGGKLLGGELEKYVQNSPLKMDGALLDTKQLDLSSFENLKDFNAWVQIFGSPTGESSLRYVLKKRDYVWQIKVWPGNSKKMGMFDQILNTFRPYNN